MGAQTSVNFDRMWVTTDSSVKIHDDFIGKLFLSIYISTNVFVFSNMCRGAMNKIDEKTRQIS